MLTVYKYPVTVTSRFEIEMPDAQLLTVQMQYGCLQLWALVNTETPLRKRRFRLVGTGQPFEERDFKYIGTCQLQDGALVFHLFEVFVE